MVVIRNSTQNVYDKIILKIYMDQKILIIKLISETDSEKNEKFEIKYKNDITTAIKKHFFEYYLAVIDTVQFIPPLE